MTDPDIAARCEPPEQWRHLEWHWLSQLDPIVDNARHKRLLPLRWQNSLWCIPSIGWKSPEQLLLEREGWTYHAPADPNAQAEIERLRDLFRMDGEQHASFVKNLTKNHENRITKYAEKIASLHAQLATAERRGEERMRERAEGQVFAVIGINPGLSPLWNAACEEVAAAIRAIPLTDPTPAAKPSRYRHVERGTEYEIIGLAELQSASNHGLREGCDLVLYRGQDGKLWAREGMEFRDGRFVPVDGDAP